MAGIIDAFACLTAGLAQSNADQRPASGRIYGFMQSHMIHTVVVVANLISENLNFDENVACMVPWRSCHILISYMDPLFNVLNLANDTPCVHCAGGLC